MRDAQDPAAGRRATLHLVVGIALIAAFLASGLMLRAQRAAHPDELLLRAMARASHIYVLFAGLVNLALSTNRSVSTKRWVRVTGALGTALVLGGSGLLVVAFFVEPNTTELKRPFTLPAMLALAGGTVLATTVSMVTERR